MSPDTDERRGVQDAVKETITLVRGLLDEARVELAKVEQLLDSEEEDGDDHGT